MGEFLFVVRRNEVAVVLKLGPSVQLHSLDVAVFELTDLAGCQPIGLVHRVCLLVVSTLHVIRRQVHQIVSLRKCIRSLFC